jgi:hypothetical protein
VTHAATLRPVAAIQLTCDIDGCGASWSVSSAAKMKASVAEHREKEHPNWVAPAPKAMTPYRIEYSRRGRQF